MQEQTLIVWCLDILFKVLHLLSKNDQNLTKYHIPYVICTAGDIVNNDGTGNTSIYGDHFPDENFRINHTAPGFVSMVNSGKICNLLSSINDFI